MFLYLYGQKMNAYENVYLYGQKKKNIWENVSLSVWSKNECLWKCFYIYKDKKWMFMKMCLYLYGQKINVRENDYVSFS